MRLVLLLALLCFAQGLQWFEEGDPVFVDDKNFTAVMARPNKYKFVKLFTPWCHFCRVLKEVVKELKHQLEERKDIEFYEVNCHLNQNTCFQLQAFSFPMTLMYGADGQLKDRIVGALPLEHMKDFALRNSQPQLKQEAAAPQAENPQPDQTKTEESAKKPQEPQKQEAEKPAQEGSEKAPQPKAEQPKAEPAAVVAPSTDSAPKEQPKPAAQQPVPEKAPENPPPEAKQEPPKEEAKPQPKPQEKAQPKPQPKIQEKPEPKPQVKVEEPAPPKEEPKVQTKPEVPQPQQPPPPEHKPQPKPQPKPEPVIEPPKQHPKPAVEHHQTKAEPAPVKQHVEQRHPTVSHSLQNNAHKSEAPQQSSKLYIIAYIAIGVVMGYYLHDVLHRDHSAQGSRVI